MQCHVRCQCLMALITLCKVRFLSAHHTLIYITLEWIFSSVDASALFHRATSPSHASNLAHLRSSFFHFPLPPHCTYMSIINMLRHCFFYA